MRFYVIQVIGGRERTGAELLRRHAADAIEECFLPTFELMRRKDGAWRKVRELLFPGYLFVKTTDPERLAARLRRVRCLRLTVWRRLSRLHACTRQTSPCASG